MMPHAPLLPPAVPTSPLSAEALVVAQQQARRRALQRLVQALLREQLLGRELLIESGDDSLLVPLWRQKRLLRLNGVRAGSLASWRFDGEATLLSAHGARVIERPSELLTLIADELPWSVPAADLARLTEELDDSFHNDSLCLAWHGNWRRRLIDQIRRDGSGGLLDWLCRGHGEQPPTVLLEQWGTLGHPWHPNHKTKLGLTPEEILAYSPEFEARVGIEVLAVHHTLMHIEYADADTDYRAWFARQFPDVAQRWQQALLDQGLTPAEYLPLPAHPWQVEQRLPELFPALFADGHLLATGVTLPTAPTMSFRTVAPLTDASAPHLKLPVGLHLTSAQRTISPKSAQMGPRFSRVLRTILDREDGFGGRLDMLAERIGLHHRLGPDDLSRHLGVLIRDNPASRAGRDAIAVPVGALFADAPLTGRALVTELVGALQTRTGLSPLEAALQFARDYFELVLGSLLPLYLHYGIVCEAHQQNSFLILRRDLRLSRLLLRDFGDVRVHLPTLRARGYALQVYPQAPNYTDDWLKLRHKLLHAVFMCHLGELILLLAREYQLAESLLWGEFRLVLAAQFCQLQPQVEAELWQREYEALFHAPWPAKALLRMRLCDSSDDAHETLPNPLLDAR